MSEVIVALQILFVFNLFYISSFFTKSERRRFVKSCFTKREFIVEKFLEENGSLTAYSYHTGGVDTGQLIKLIFKSLLAYFLVCSFTNAVGMNINYYIIFLIGVLMTAYQLTKRFRYQKKTNLKQSLAQ